MEEGKHIHQWFEGGVGGIAKHLRRDLEVGVAQVELESVRGLCDHLKRALGGTRVRA